VARFATGFRMGQLVLRALFIAICVIADAFFVFVIHGMLGELKHRTKLDWTPFWSCFVLWSGAAW
jgi:hypothetical protein